MLYKYLLIKYQQKGSFSCRYIFKAL